MNDSELRPNQSSNYLFAFLGGICALVVGIAFFGNDPSRSPASQEPIPVAYNYAEAFSSLPILE
jgi:hypothetical protein